TNIARSRMPPWVVTRMSRSGCCWSTTSLRRSSCARSCTSLPLPMRDRCDVAVVGLGPVGAVAANLLGLSGINAIALEAQSAIWSTPRAIGMDHEVMRILQSLGIADAMAAHMGAYRPSEYRAAD